MKKILLLSWILLGFFMGLSQAPEKMSYQAVMRNGVGQLLSNQAIAVKVSILQGSPAGAEVYSERLTGNTNTNGLISLEIGTGTIITGTFASINWSSGNYYLKTETDPAGGTNYTITGTSQLLSVPYAMYAKTAGNSGGTFTIPYTNTVNNASTLFSLTNDGDGTSLEGTNNTATSSIAAVRGIVTSTGPGGFSSGVRGINNGTGGLGVGVWGSQNGSGWGIYGVTPNGLGVYGNSSGNGYGVYANSNTGTGLSATSNNGIPANIAIFNNANNNNVLNASTLGNGTVINVTTSGNGTGVFSSTGSGFAVHGITSAQTSAGIIGDNSGAGEAVVGRTTSDIAGAVVGRNDGGGYGVRGFIATNATGTGIGVYGQVGLNNSTGRAGRFENLNQTNTTNNTFEVETNGNGNIPDNTQGNAASFLVNNTNSVGAAVRGQVNTIFGNFGAAGVFGISSGTGGFAGLFHASNPSGNGAALVAITDGNGNAITANASKNGNGIETNIDGNGNALYAWVPSFATGRAGRFNIFNDANTSDVITVTTVGNGTAGNFKVDKTQGTSPAVKGEVNSIFANFGTAGIYGLSSGTGGYGGLFYSSNASGNGPALLALTEGNGNGITANAGGTGDGIEASCDGNGNAISGFIPNFGTGKAGRFANFNNSNGQPVVHVTTTGTGSTLLVNHQGPSGDIAVYQSASTNVARINKAGRGFFNGGTQASGADVAEAFDVEGKISEYETGDILVISVNSDRTVEKSSKPYSNLVAGVYATKPGVLLTEEHIDTDISDKVPMGVIGVIPTKVCLENGKIKRGDLLVTSSTPGVAMKASLKKVKIGQVIGKSLQDYDQKEIGKIQVLVNIK
ncbi:beta strand repeat-containing protein [Chryseobacterium sp. KMC2]|uniref:beta strand repeat-containing protein n=1 Tax=Chryseobacterium sp. KMC2 TaxID=2800705 RepID=UPI0019247371|nr:collagen-like protein [Chryseobacterium sp. KMC2]MBL3549816.1 collagen-like protein [Chryseobacterium sp. KMC2]